MASNVSFFKGLRSASLSFWLKPRLPKAFSCLKSSSAVSTLIAENFSWTMASSEEVQSGRTCLRISLSWLVVRLSLNSGTFGAALASIAASSCCRRLSWFGSSRLVGDGGLMDEGCPACLPGSPSSPTALEKPRLGPGACEDDDDAPPGGWPWRCGISRWTNSALEGPPLGRFTLSAGEGAGADDEEDVPVLGGLSGSGRFACSTASFAFSSSPGSPSCSKSDTASSAACTASRTWPRPWCASDKQTSAWPIGRGLSNTTANLSASSAHLSAPSLSWASNFRADSCDRHMIRRSSVSGNWSRIWISSDTALTACSMSAGLCLRPLSSSFCSTEMRSCTRTSRQSPSAFVSPPFWQIFCASLATRAASSHAPLRV
mmetsp:Transcript_36814/g.105808  ORF Transcript_36814/g.105808 Transcript_36814/m.105808 type:complete len:374 (+) Transcript_36814:91-1212(+)